jgi:hypothetical protein
MHALLGESCVVDDPDLYSALLDCRQNKRSNLPQRGLLRLIGVGDEMVQRLMRLEPGGARRGLQSARRSALAGKNKPLAVEAKRCLPPKRAMPCRCKGESAGRSASALVTRLEAHLRDEVHAAARAGDNGRRVRLESELDALFGDLNQPIADEPAFASSAPSVLPIGEMRLSRLAEGGAASAVPIAMAAPLRKSRRAIGRSMPSSWSRARPRPCCRVT